jgi:hypothetical protein
MLKELLNKSKMKEAITKKGNLSAHGVDKLTYPILKYEKDEAAELIAAMMNMMIRTQRCAEAWKEGKVVRLPTPCSEIEKNLPQNWRLITLTNILDRIMFGRIADYFQLIHKKKSVKGEGIVFKKYKRFIKNINGCCKHIARINFLINRAIDNNRSCMWHCWITRMYLVEFRINY